MDLDYTWIADEHHDRQLLPSCFFQHDVQVGRRYAMRQSVIYQPQCLNPPNFEAREQSMEVVRIRHVIPSLFKGRYVDVGIAAVGCRGG